jgi:nucleotide-binding universal stress UspA family protein
MKPYTKILVPTDFSSSATEALHTAVDLAARYGASITLVHVFEPLVYPFPEATGFSSILNLADVIEDIDKLLEKNKQAALDAGAKTVTATQLQGHPPSEIADYAKAGGFDLIVMGTHGRRGLSRLMIGSVAERVVRIAPCAVLTVRDANG